MEDGFQSHKISLQEKLIFPTIIFTFSDFLLM